MIIAKKGVAYYLSFPCIDSTTPESYKSGVSPVDTAYYKDGAGAWTSLAITDTASEIGSTGVYEIDLSASELNHDKVIIKFAVSGMADDAYQFDLRTKLVDDLNDVSTAQVNTECDTALTDYDGPTNAEMVARTLSAASYFDPSADTVANVTTVATTTTNTDMRGTDSAALAAVCTEVRLAELTAANLPADIDAILTDTGTTLPGTISTIDTNVDAILVDTGTTLPGTLSTINTNVSSVLTDTAEIGAAGAGLTGVGGMSTTMKAQINTEVSDVLKTDTITEIAQGTPTATPTFEQAVMYVYMALRNKIDITSATKEFHNDAGTVIWKKALTDDGTTYSEAEGVTGP